MFIVVFLCSSFPRFAISLIHMSSAVTKPVCTDSARSSNSNFKF